MFEERLESHRKGDEALNLIQDFYFLNFNGANSIRTFGGLARLRYNVGTGTVTSEHPDSGREGIVVGNRCYDTEIVVHFRALLSGEGDHDKKTLSVIKNCLIVAEKPDRSSAYHYFLCTDLWTFVCERFRRITLYFPDDCSEEYKEARKYLLVRPRKLEKGEKIQCRSRLPSYEDSCNDRSI